MATLESEEQNIITSTLLQQLSRTAYACSSLSQPLGSRDGNVVYRGILTQPLRAMGQDGATTVKRSIIIKYSTTTDDILKDFEERLLNSLSEFSPSTSTATTTTVRAPRLYLYDRDSNIQILEDFTNTIDFKTVLFTSSSHNILSPGISSSSSSSATSIGYTLGSWLRSFHTWSSAPEQASLRAQMWRNNHMRKIKHHYTYNTIIRVLGNYPQLLEGYERTLEDFRDVIAKEFERPFVEGQEKESEGYGLVHGDFWLGNILLRNPTPKDKDNIISPTTTTTTTTTTELFVIDWEFAQYGHRSTDLGQILGDLYERKIYNNLDITIPVLQGVINGYGGPHAVSDDDYDDEMAFRTAVYVGVHLVSYYDRRPRKGPRAVSEDVLVAGLRVGRDFIVKGWEKDREFFRGGALELLFGR